jgi:hypothetical protein
MIKFRANGLLMFKSNNFKMCNNNKKPIVIAIKTDLIGYM